MTLMEKVVSSEQGRLEDHVKLAEWMILAGFDVDPTTAIVRLLNDEDAGTRHVTAALRLTSRFPDFANVDIENSKAIARLSFDQTDKVVNSLRSTRGEAKIAARLIRAALRCSNGVIENEQLISSAPNVASEFSLSLIAGGDYALARQILGLATAHLDRPEVRFVFNLGMAIWGETREIPLTNFDQFLRMAQAAGPPSKINVNYNQCVGLARIILGDVEGGLQKISVARAQFPHRGSAFSCWSYLEGGESAFAHDLEEMRQWTREADLIPRVFRENADPGGT
jgi:hypothetical protein